MSTGAHWSISLKVLNEDESNEADVRVVPGESIFTVPVRSTPSAFRAIAT